MSETGAMDTETLLHEYNVRRYSALDHVTYYADYISIPLCLAVIFADMLLVYVISKYKVMKTRTNCYLLHYAICNLMNVISTPMLYIVLDIFLQGYIEVTWHCSFVQLKNLFLNLFLVFITFASVDATLDTLDNHFVAFYRKQYRYFFAMVYFVFIIVYLSIGSFCFKKRNNDFSFTVSTITYSAIIVVILIVNYLKIKNDDIVKTNTLLSSNINYILPVSNIVTLCWLPIFLYLNLMMTFENKSLIYWLKLTTFIAEWLANGSVIIVVYKLGKLNKFFRLAYCKVFRISSVELDFERLNKCPGT